MTKKPPLKSGTDPKNVLLSDKIIENNDMIHPQEYQPFQNALPQNVQLESNDLFKAFLHKYLEKNAPKLLPSGEEHQFINNIMNTSSINNGNNNSNKHNLISYQSLSPIHKPYYNNSKNSPGIYSPQRRTDQSPMRLNRRNSFSWNDELLKNNAMKQLMPNNIHTNYDIGNIKTNLIDKKPEENNNGTAPPFLDHENSNLSIHSQNMFDLDFNYDNDMNLEKKDTSRFFDDLSSINNDK